VLYTWVDGQAEEGCDELCRVGGAAAIKVPSSERAMTKARRGRPGWWYGDAGVV
jgi:hypothetical protein